MTLTCFYGQGSYTSLSSVYECDAKVIFNYEQSKVTGVTGNHKQNRTNNDVNFLHIREQNLQSLPKEIEKFFPNLKGIYASNNKIKFIAKDDLKVFPNLQYVNLYANDITSLDDDLFSASSNLQVISFELNKIKQIGINTFKHLTNLQHLWLDGARNCISDNANTRDEVESLISRLSSSCPSPSKITEKNSNMQEESETGNESFETNVVIQLGSLKNQIEALEKGFETRFDTMETNFKEFDTKLNLLQSQIEYIVNKIKSI